MLAIYFLGLLVILVVTLVVLVDAYKEGGILHAVLVLFLPFYVLYWLFFRQSHSKGPLVVAAIVGTLLAGAPRFLAGGITSSETCGLISEEEITAELGLATKSSKEYDAGQRQSCKYILESEPPKILTLVVGECSPETISERRSSRNFSVSEVGDEAVSAGNVLLARQATTCYALSFDNDSDPASTLQQRKALVRNAMARKK